MKIILKNLKQVKFEIQIESNLITVKDLKIEIEKLYSFDSEQIKLLSNGSILDNTKLLSEYNIKEDSTIIMMNTKPKKLGLNTENKNVNTNNTNQPNLQLQNQQKPNISEILKDNLKIQIDSLVDMGFERSQVEIAVKAANGRIDLAVEYLNNGIPDNIKNNRMNNNKNIRNNNRNEITKELKKQASIIKVLCKDNKFLIFSILNNIKRNDPGLLRLITDYQDEFRQYLDEPITQEDELNYKNIETKADEIIKKRFEEKAQKLKEKEEKEKKEKEEKEEKEKEEKKENEKKEEKEEKEEEQNGKKINKEEGQEDTKEKIEVKKDQENSEIQNKSEEKKENSESKMGIEQEKKEEMKMEEEEEKLKESIENKEQKDNEKINNMDIEKIENKKLEENKPENNIESQITEEDKQIIERLKNLGNFPHEKVVEAFIVCNKDEELTANYLFEQFN